MGDPDFTWDYCWATQMAELVLGECPASYSCEVLVLVIAVMEFLLLRFAAIILMARSPIIISHADIFPFSCGQDAYSQGESLVVDVAGSVARIERLADGHCHHNWLYAGVGGDIPGAIAVLFQSGFLFLPRITSAGTPLVGKGISTVRRLTALRGLSVFSGPFGLISWT